MEESGKTKQYNLESRTLKFAQDIRVYIFGLPKTLTNIEYAKQLTRSSGSVGANYIEANESLGKKDFVMRIKISRKEAKESKYWLELTQPNSGKQIDKDNLIKESIELTKIFGSIVEKMK
ncbi:MAG TPA: four helix bundle protein [Candidatus Paceibacterota bacterium]|nr:four helix bundle protein [Candidatus Paceibacterota bacterium]